MQRYIHATIVVFCLFLSLNASLRAQDAEVAFSGKGGQWVALDPERNEIFMKLGSSIEVPDLYSAVYLTDNKGVLALPEQGKKIIKAVKIGKTRIKLTTEGDRMGIYYNVEVHK